MNSIKIIGCILSAVMASGCASMDGVNGPHGARLVGSGRATESGQYVEVGVEFSSVGDFVALVNPSRWKSPMATGGTLSWMNPVAWSDDAGRTGRILMGQAVVVGGVVVAATAGGGGGGGGGGGAYIPGDSGPSNPSAPPQVPSTPPR